MMDMIQPVEITDSVKAAIENVVDTTLVHDWK